MTWEDKIYGIPQTTDMQMLYYRKSVLDKAGVQPPTTLVALTDRRQQGRWPTRTWAASSPATTAVSACSTRC